MLAVNYTTIRNNLKDILDKVADDCETVIITRKDDKSVVMMSLEQYNNFMENEFVRSQPQTYRRLLQSKKQLEQGKYVEKSTKELEAMAHD